MIFFFLFLFLLTEYVQCAYNPSHVIITRRYPEHLVRCESVSFNSVCVLLLWLRCASFQLINLIYILFLAPETCG